MQLPTTDPLNLSHFNLYAPSAKHLEIPAVLPVDEYENWSDFLDCVHSLSLLPNLERLELSVSEGHPAVSLGTINMIIAFLSPSLLHLDISSNSTGKFLLSAGIQPGLTRKLLRNVSRKCSRLESLSLLPGEILRGSISFSLALQDIYTPLSSLRALRTLLITPVIIKPLAFRALGRLPSLESLSIVSPNHNPENYPNNLEIPDDAFSSLINLELIGLSWSTIINLCRLKPLVQTLKSARFESLGYTPTNDMKSHFQLVSILANHKSPINQLSVIGYCQNWDIPSEFVGSIQCLPLVSLT